MEQPLTELSPFVGMEDDPGAFLILEDGTSRDVFSAFEFDLDLEDLFEGDIPDENSNACDIVVGFSEIWFIFSFAFSSEEVAFGLLDFLFRDVNPSVPILAPLRPPKHVVLDHFFMCLFRANRFERIQLFDFVVLFVEG